MGCSRHGGVQGAFRCGEGVRVNVGDLGMVEWGCRACWDEVAGVHEGCKGSRMAPGWVQDAGWGAGWVQDG